MNERDQTTVESDGCSVCTAITVAADQTVMRLACSRGYAHVQVGAFFWAHGALWEIERPAGRAIYSPSGLGGTPTVWCRVVGGRPSGVIAHHADVERLEWCGDSVAAECLKGWQ